MSPTTQQAERTVKLAEGLLELGVGDESEPGHESESKGGDPEQQIKSDGQSPQKIATLRKLNNTWTGSPPTALSSRTTSGGGAAVTDGHEAALNVVLARDGEVEHKTVAHEPTTNLSAIKTALVKSGGYGNDLPPEPRSRRQAMGWPEWKYWEAAEKTEVGGLISKVVWTQCPRPKGNVVLGTKRLSSRRIGERGEVVKHECRFVAHGLWKIRGLHRFSLSMEMSRLTRDGTAEPVSRDQIIRRERVQININFPCSADHEQDWQPYPVDP